MNTNSLHHRCACCLSWAQALVRASPDATLLIVTNPVDIMTLVAYNLAGLPRSRVMGSGTMLDSGRFRGFLAEAFKVCHFREISARSSSSHPLTPRDATPHPHPCMHACQVNDQSVGGFVVGEHGDTSVALLSSVTIGGVPWRKLLPCPSGDRAAVLEGLQDKVRDSARAVIAAKVCPRPGCMRWPVTCDPFTSRPFTFSGLHEHRRWSVRGVARARHSHEHRHGPTRVSVGPRVAARAAGGPGRGNARRLVLVAPVLDQRHWCGQGPHAGGGRQRGGARGGRGVAAQRRSPPWGPAWRDIAATSVRRGRQCTARLYRAPLNRMWCRAITYLNAL